MSRSRPWVLLGAFCLIGFLINASTFYALGVVLPAMVREENWNWAQAGLGFTILGAAVGSSSYIPALMIRRFGVRWTLLAGTGVMAAGFACLALTNGIGLYFLGAALCGVGYQMMALIPGAYVISATFPRRGLPLGLFFTASSLGGVAGPWIALAVMSGSGGQWRLLWLTALVAILAIGSACALVVGGPAWLAQAAAETDLEVREEVARPARRGVWRTDHDWTVDQALRTPQFYILAAAYFGHLLVGVTVSSLSVAHLTERGISDAVAVAMLSLEALVQTAGRAIGGLIGDLIDPRYILIFALAALSVGAAALSMARDYPMLLTFAIGSGLGFGLTALAVTMLLLNYFGRTRNLELFSLTCLVGAASALGPVIGGALRDATGGFGSTFQIFAGLIAVVFVAAAVMRPPRWKADG